ncbi:peptidoglycan DD-metalloendopeptidase family protein [Alkalihalobacillus oceani]|uniref:Peptidoglycan DD-metalloendopeptidase family protein n=1 Tax=Halalkalibacter oceani TaxID=1653776 RepID=A0A9X2DR87_9BACI|nr:M23 family metallopeptidase [Halalkalibacter oceani]MCM3715469.1 peptidoglycan DD-metalloendopeptidase family protein [Halalkalibacter oceani]
MKKGRFFAVLSFMTACALVWPSVDDHVFANEGLNEKISNVQEERKSNQEQARQTEEELKAVSQQLSSLNQEIRIIDEKTSETNQNLRDKQAEIDEVTKEIERLKEELKVLEERIAERDNLLKDRAKSMYQSGGAVNYLEVILGAKNFGDFLDRISALSVIAQQDKNILDAHVADYEELERMKSKVTEKLSTLEEHLSELERLKAKLEVQRKEKDQLLASVQTKESDLQSNIDMLDAEDEILRSQERSLTNQLTELETERISAAHTPSRSNGNTIENKPVVTNSGFMRPATGSITSEYGPRWGRVHHGMDIGKNGRSGDVPIVAAQEGRITTAQYSSSYGNYVVISHNVEGQQISTLYAHMDRLDVNAGQNVAKGQQIGLMGNTGQSFGAHLHFEVHTGGWNASKSNSVNPRQYLP